jgi:hypothetical protein
MLPVRKLNCSTLLTSTQKERKKVRKKEETGMVNSSWDRYFRKELFFTASTTKYYQRYYNNSYTASVHIKNHLQFSEIFELSFHNIWNRSCQVVAL